MRDWQCAHLEHGEKQVLFTALVLVSVDCEHDCLEEGVDLGHGDEAAEVGNVSGLGLEEEEEVPVFLRLVVVGKEALLQVEAFFEVAGDFILLRELACDMRTVAVT